MTPLEIQLLLNLYVSPAPAINYPSQQRTAPAMREAFYKFQTLGILKPGMTHERIMLEVEEVEDPLTVKGMLLVERLMEVQP